jgi:hypothetical protein
VNDRTSTLLFGLFFAKRVCGTYVTQRNNRRNALRYSQLQTTLTPSSF